jgi:hypothetical protein
VCILLLFQVINTYLHTETETEILLLLTMLEGAGIYTLETLGAANKPRRGKVRVPDYLHLSTLGIHLVAVQPSVSSDGSLSMAPWRSLMSRTDT